MEGVDVGLTTIRSRACEGVEAGVRHLAPEHLHLTFWKAGVFDVSSLRCSYKGKLTRRRDMSSCLREQDAHEEEEEEEEGTQGWEDCCSWAGAGELVETCVVSPVAFKPIARPPPAAVAAPKGIGSPTPPGGGAGTPIPIPPSPPP
ncbi:hypothetical protein E2C01_004331 [Portunus trituberculatus]|uniref:Uncharacterized protein n=1 Tax=Portunus trituberculatus TaxID=210409 RepID=A0A5B7CQF2_PORTR|nr:hypothetical protein [Portunus trituberculatus]